MVEKKEQELKPGQIRLLRPFGPAIAHVKMPENLIEELNSLLVMFLKNLNWKKIL